ncbi:MAG: T9SS type A sorting domain-containing protein, partial [Crocinitomix sp.]|nr:T9SS type A sorting domain-containing protein [Crocinitomix sp.]
IQLHPNPTTGLIYITHSGTDAPFKLEIYTTEGKQVYTSEGLNLNGNEPIDLSYLARGVYFVKISTRENQFQEKVILH